MISALILHERPEPALALDLSRLVEGVLDGLLSDVAILDGVCDPLAEKLADDGGCALIRAADAEQAWRAGLAALRGDWILIAPSGLALSQGWTGAVRDAFALAAAGRPLDGVWLRAGRTGGALAALASLFRRPPGVVLCRRALLAGAKTARDVEAARRKDGWRVVDGHVVDERAR